MSKASILLSILAKAVGVILMKNIISFHSTLKAILHCDGPFLPTSVRNGFVRPDPRCGQEEIALEVDEDLLAHHPSSY